MKEIPIKKSLLSFALLAFFAVSLFGQETARDKEISRLFDSGQINLWEKRFPQALADFQKALRLDPTNNSVHYYFGRIYLESGAYDQAIAEFEKHLQQSPDENWSVAFIGEAYLQKRRRRPRRPISDGKNRGGRQLRRLLRNQSRSVSEEKFD